MSKEGYGAYARDTGKAPIQRECPTCSRLVGGFFAMGRFQIARHMKPTGGRCRTVREPGSGKIVIERKGA